MNRLVIIDGNAILHRAFHALPPLTDLNGTIVNAVYGFATMLFRIGNDLKPTHIAVAFDRPAPTFRKEMFKAYQATRPKMDDTLVPQIERVHEMVRAFHIPIFEMDGYEADDVIGTICRKFQIPNSKSQISNLKSCFHFCPSFCHTSYSYRDCGMCKWNIRAIIHTILSTFLLSLYKSR